MVSYVKTPGALDIVTLAKDPVRLHGLARKRGNHAMERERKLFTQFFRSNRSPTGHTKDPHGRVHGAEYYLNSKWTVLRKQTGKYRNPAVVNDSEVFGEVFN